MKLYEVSSGDHQTKVFRSIDAARRYVREEGIKNYTLDRVETAPLTLDLLIEVINSCGGGYVVERAQLFNNLY